MLEAGGEQAETTLPHAAADAAVMQWTCLYCATADAGAFAAAVCAVVANGTLAPSPYTLAPTVPAERHRAIVT